MASRSATRSTTLEVTPLDAQKLALGQQLGQLSLVLRKPGEEQNIAEVETVSLDDLRYSYYGSLPPGARPRRRRAAGQRRASAAARTARRRSRA